MILEGDSPFSGFLGPLWQNPTLVFCSEFCEIPNELENDISARRLIAKRPVDSPDLQIHSESKER